MIVIATVLVTAVVLLVTWYALLVVVSEEFEDEEGDIRHQLGVPDDNDNES